MDYNYDSDFVADYLADAAEGEGWEDDEMIVISDADIDYCIIMDEWEVFGDA